MAIFKQGPAPSLRTWLHPLATAQDADGATFSLSLSFFICLMGDCTPCEYKGLVSLPRRTLEKTIQRQEVD